MMDKRPNQELLVDRSFCLQLSVFFSRANWMYIVESLVLNKITAIRISAFVVPRVVAVMENKPSQYRTFLNNRDYESKVLP
jgi:hypothetical protein